MISFMGFSWDTPAVNWACPPFGPRKAIIAARNLPPFNPWPRLWSQSD